MGFYQCDFAILDFLRSSGWLKKGMSVLEFGSQDLKEDRNGNICGEGGRIRESRRNVSMMIMALADMSASTLMAGMIACNLIWA